MQRKEKRRKVNRNRKLVVGATLGEEEPGESESKAGTGCNARKRGG